MALKYVQLGKKGLTENFIESLKGYFKNYQNVKISVLKSACRDREELTEIKDKILDKLGANYKARVIGYTIVVKKWRRAVR